jgi:hypothetical protein
MGNPLQVGAAASWQFDERHHLAVYKQINQLTTP